MSMLEEMLGAGVVLSTFKAAQRGLDRLWPAHPHVVYKRTETGEWIAEYKGHTGIGKTRREATRIVGWLAGEEL